MLKNLTISLLLFWGFAQMVQSQVLQYAGSQTLALANTPPTGITTQNLTLGGSFSAAAGCANGLNLSNATTSAGTVTVQVVVQTGYSMTLTNLTCGFRRSGNGAASLTYSYKIGNNGSLTSSGSLTPTTSCLTSANTNGDWNFADFTVNQGDTLFLIGTYTGFAGTSGNTQLLTYNINGSVSIVAPSVNATNLSSSAPTNTTIPSLTWVNGNGARRIVIVSQTNPVSFVPSDGTDYTTGVNANFSTATDRGSNNRIVYNGTGNSVSITGLSNGTTYYIRVYEYNGTGAQTKYSTGTGTNNPKAFSTTNPSNSNSSDIVTNGSYTYSTGIAYSSFQASSGLTTGNTQGLMGIRLRDGGASNDADALTTSLQSLTLSLTSGHIRTLGLFQGGSLVSEVAVNGGTSASFTGLSISAADNDSTALELRGTFMSSVTDQQRITLTVTAAQANVAGSVFTTSDAGAAQSSQSGNNNKISVVANGLAFVQSPTNTAINVAMSPAVTVHARDANGNRDIDFVSSIQLVSTGTLSGTTISSTASIGIATFSSLTHTATGTNLYFTATAPSQPGWTVNSSTFNIVITSSATDIFRSRQSGSWGTTTTWESSADSISWVSPATLSPSNTSKRIIILSPHTVALTSNVTLDSLVIESGGTLNHTAGTLTINNGTGNDITVKGTWIHDNGNGVPAGTGTAEIQNGGMLQINDGSGQADQFLNDESSSYLRFVFKNGGIAHYANSTAFSATGITYFPGQSTSEIPIFRISGNLSTIGGGSATVFNARLEVMSGFAVGFSGTGTKTVRDGIIGAGSFTQNSGCGQIQISGANAQLGGSGSLTLSVAVGLQINSGSLVTLTSNKAITSNSITVAGTLDASTYQITGTATVLVNGELRTSNTNGLVGTNCTFPSGSTLSTLPSGSTIHYNGGSTQAITARQYQNLRLSGAGTKTFPADTVSIGGSFLPGTATCTTTSSIIKLNGTAAQTLVDAFTFEDLVLQNTSAPTSSAITITSGMQQIRGILTPYAGALVTNGNLRLLSTASKTAMINRPAAPTSVITGNVNVQRYISSATGKRFMSSPVSGRTAADWWQHRNVRDIYFYDETYPGVQNVGWFQAYGTYPLTAGQGFQLFFARADTTMALTGSVNSGTVTLPLNTFTVDLSNRNASGWVLAGNPYPSTINWNSVSGWTRVNMLNAIYYINPSTGTLATFMNGVGSGGATSFIPSGQGFWVRNTGTGAQLTCTEAVKSTQQSTFFKENPTGSNEIRLTLSETTTDKFSEAVVLLPSLDSGLSEEHSLTNAPLPPMVKDLDIPVVTTKNEFDEEFTIQEIPVVSSTAIHRIPVGIQTPDNYWSFSLSYLSDSFEVELEDQYLGKSYSSSELSGIVFTNKEIENRFYLKIIPKANQQLTQIEASSIRVWPNPLRKNGTLHISQGVESVIADLIYLDGRIEKVQISPSGEITLPELTAGWYGIRIEIAGHPQVVPFWKE